MPLGSTSMSWRYCRCDSAARRRASASPAASPAAIRSRLLGPRRGSVMFWLATTPTPARACAQRAATAGDDDEIAMPNMPVAASRATIEKVTSCLVGDDRGDVNLDQPLRPRQRRDHDARRDREDPLQPFADDAIDGLAIARIG